MQIVTCYLLSLITAVCSLHVLGISLYKAGESEEPLLNSLNQWQDDALVEPADISFIQLLSDGDNFSKHREQPKPPTNNNSSYHPSNDTVIEENQAYIDAGELVMLDGNMTDTHKQDALASALFAQSAADYKYSRTAKPEEWNKYYGVVLGQIGWVLVKNSFEDVKVDDVFVVSEVVLKKFEEKFSELDEELISYLREFLNNLEVLTASNPSVEIFYNKSYSNGSINFAVSFYDEGDDESVMLFSSRVYFDVCEMSKPFLFHLFAPECVSGKLHIEILEYKLSEDTYSSVRNTILEKLGNRMKTYITKMKPF